MKHEDSSTAWSLPGSISVTRQGGRRILCLAGEIDAAVVARFEAEHGFQALDIDAVDAGAVTFIGAAGVELMLWWMQHSAAHGRQPVLRTTSRAVERVLALTKLDGNFARPPAINGSG
jgi:anti-anti-sigma factor